jgi:hypothetical protein
MVLLFVSLVAAAVLASGLVLTSVLMARSAGAALTCGPSWQRVPLPSGLKYPQALAPIAADDIWVVGNSRPSISAGIATAHWNGSSWTIFSKPQPGSGANELNGVDGVASDDVWTVGAYSENTLPAKTLVEHCLPAFMSTTTTRATASPTQPPLWGSGWRIPWT